MLRRAWRSIGRGIKRAGASLGFALLALPILALLLPPFLDRGPSGEWRRSIFALGLTLWDPAVWNGALASLATAFGVVFASRWIGVRLGRALGEGPYWGRPILAVVVVLPLAAGPLVVSLAIRIFLADHPVPTELGGLIPSVNLPIDLVMRWLGLGWAEVLRATALVAMATSESLRSVDPLWLDAAESVGGTRRSAWSPLIWPILRPTIRRLEATIFAWVLFDPTASLAFGLDAPLPAQAVRAILRDGDLARASILALLAAGLASVGRSWLISRGDEPDPIAAIHRGRLLSPGETVARLLTGLVWTVAAVGPMFAGLRVLLRDVGFEADFEPFILDVLPALGRSIGPAAAGVVVALLVARGLGGARTGKIGRVPGWIAGRIGRVPPLTLAVGIAGLSGLSLFLADRAALGIPLAPAISKRLVESATLLHPVRGPWLLFGWAVGLSSLGLAFRLESARRERFRREWEDAATLLGARSDQARRAARRFPWSGLRVSAVAWLIVCAATDLALPLVLSPARGSQPLGPLLLNDALSLSSGTPALWAAIVMIVRMPAFYFALMCARSFSLRAGTPDEDRGFIA